MHTAGKTTPQRHRFRRQARLEKGQFVAERRVVAFQRLTVVGFAAEDGDFHGMDSRLKSANRIRA
jgi:hypothetical protein